MNEVIKCPVCRGKGELLAPKKKLNYPNMIKVLVDAGYSYRQIMKFFQWKSPGIISYYLGKSKKL